MTAFATTAGLFRALGIFSVCRHGTRAHFGPGECAWAFPHDWVRFDMTKCSALLMGVA